MKLAAFKADGGMRVGIAADGKLIDLNLGYALYLKEVQGLKNYHRKAALEAPQDMIGFLNVGGKAVEAAEETLGYVTERLRKGDVRGPRGEKLVYRLNEVSLKAPVPKPPKLLCLAGNYYGHVKETGGQVYDKGRIHPYVFMKPPSTAVIGPEDPILVSRFSERVDWEVELAVVVGRKGKYIPRDEAYDYVAGYTVLNDVSDRSFIVKKDRATRDLDRFFDWYHGKVRDTFAPMGPYLTLKDEVKDPQNLRITLRVNGETMQDSRTGDMVFTVPEIIEFISCMITLEPGDVIATGTPAGIGAVRGRFLKPGDVVEAEVESVGTLRNPVRAE